MEAAFNHDTFRDRSIDSVGQMNLPDGERFTARTSAGAVAIGRALDISPQRLEHLASGYFGWLGIQAMNAADWIARPHTKLPDNPKQDMARIDNWFIAGDFIKTAQPRTSKYIERFYEQQKEINALYAAMRQAQKTGDLEHARALAATPKLRLHGLYKNAGNRISQINQTIRKIERSTLPAATKRKQQDALYAYRAQLAKQADERARARDLQ